MFDRQQQDRLWMARGMYFFMVTNLGVEDKRGVAVEQGAQPGAWREIARVSVVLIDDDVLGRFNAGGLHYFGPLIVQRANLKVCKDHVWPITFH